MSKPSRKSQLKEAAITILQMIQVPFLQYSNTTLLIIYCLGSESPKKMRVAEMPLTPDQPQRAPNTPKSDFHKYAESVLSPIGIETPGAPFNSGLLKIPTSR